MVQRNATFKWLYHLYVLVITPLPGGIIERGGRVIDDTIYIRYVEG